MAVRFDNKVAVITGAGGGLGRSYALLLGSLGAKIVVNDLGVGLKGETSNIRQKRQADIVVEEIKKKGGEAVPNYDSVEFGNKIVETAIKTYGRIDILINNAGILRDVSFNKMKEEEWDMIMRVHLKGAYSCTKAAWKYMIQQNYGRIINTCSAAGLYGNFGQVNYSAAKIALVGFSKSLAFEGSKYNIKVNCIAPLAGTRMTETVMPKEIVDALKPEYVAPVVAYLVSDKCTDSGEIFEVGAGWVANVRWERSEGYLFSIPFNINDVYKNWFRIKDFQKHTYPNSLQDSIMMVTQRLSNENNEENKENIYKEKYKSEKIFNLMSEYLKKANNEESMKLTENVKSIFNFDISLKKNSAPVASWVIDLKNANGNVYEGKNDKADASFSMTDEDFVSVCLGKLNPQTAFLQGKMKIKGNMRAATKFTPNLFPKINEEILKKDINEAIKLYLNQNENTTMNNIRKEDWSSEVLNLKSFPILNIIKNYLNTPEGKALSNKVKYTYKFDILPKKGGKPLSFIFDFKSAPPKFCEGAPDKYDAAFTMLDEDFANLVTGKLNPQKAFILGKMKIKGNMKAAMEFKPDLFPKVSSL